MNSPLRINKYRKRVASTFAQRNYSSKSIPPTVSFTFDDIHHTAVSTGSKILDKHHLKGTFYCSHLFENHPDGYIASHIRELIQAEHQIACHSFDHLKLYDVGLEQWKANIEDNRLYFFEKYGLRLEHFAYPGGQQSLKAKKFLRSHYASLRGIEAGVNDEHIDVLNLKANQLYGKELKEQHKKRIKDLAKKGRGWLLFYTHDIQDEPSPFGCSPEVLLEAIALCRDLKLEISPVSEYYDQLTATSM